MGDWFEDDKLWETIYPVLFGHERWDGISAEVDGVLAHAQPPPGARVLDLCCGPGRHALELARRGFRVTGVDRTPRYVDRARASAREQGLDVEWIISDMRRFRRPGTYALAVNLFTSFGYFDNPADDAWVAKNLFDSLVDGGVLVMDLMGKEVLARRFRPRDWHWVDRDRGLILLEERELDRHWGWVRSSWTLLRPGGEAEQHQIAHRLYSGAELHTLLRRVGFSDIQILGSLEGTPYDQDARRLVAVARK